MKRSLGMAPVLAALGHKVTLVMHEHPENREQAMRMPGVECVFCPAGGMPAERRWKATFLGSRSFDVIVYNSLCWRNAVPKRGASAGALALMEHCELESCNKGTSLARRTSQSLLEWWSLWAFDGHICASRYLLDLMKRRAFSFGLARKIFWSPYAVDESVCGLAPAEEAASRHAKKLIFHVGTVARNYGCLFMIDGLRVLRARRTDWRAKFAGKGRDLAAAQARVKELGLEDCVEFPGYVPEHEMRSELASARVFLSHLNDTEQDWARCPSKLYYYMALGRPIVTPALGENRVALGDSGFYYQWDNPSDFARAADEALKAGDAWHPGYTADSVTWVRRTHEFLKEIQAVAPVRAVVKAS